MRDCERQASKFIADQQAKFKAEAADARAGFVEKPGEAGAAFQYAQLFRSFGPRVQGESPQGVDEGFRPL
jgi:hypothetical protein